MPEQETEEQPQQVDISLVTLQRPISIEKMVTEKRTTTVRSYRIKDINESVTRETVRVLILLEDGSQVWVTAFSGEDYRAKFDYSQADLEEAISAKLLAGEFEG